MTMIKDGRLAGLLLIISLLFAPLCFAAPSLKANHPTRYVVKEGDTLWSISKKFLNKPWQWSELWAANSHLKNPNKIYPGDILILHITGKGPRLSVRHTGTVRLYPRMRRYRVDNAIEPIALNDIRPFLDKSQVFNTDLLEYAPYIVEFAREHLLAGKGYKFYVSAMGGKGYKHYAVYRPNGVYRDPETKEALGYSAKYVGQAQLLKSGEPATLVLTQTASNVNLGDRVLPLPRKTFSPYFIPHAPRQRVDGQVIDLIGGITQVGSNQIVVINRGRDSMLRAGDVLAIYNKGHVIQDPIDKSRKVYIPDERIGDMMVFNAFDHVSYGLVLDASDPVHKLDVVKNP
jgi:LysM domain